MALGWTFHTQGSRRSLESDLPTSVLYGVDRQHAPGPLQQKKLTRRDRMKVLGAHHQKRSYEVQATVLLTYFDTARWVHRPDKEEQMTYYTVILETLKASNDLVSGHYGFKRASQALNTFLDYEVEDRRHHDNYYTQLGIFWLTIVLMFVGVVQAGAATYDACWPKAESEQRSHGTNPNTGGPQDGRSGDPGRHGPPPRRCNVTERKLQRERLRTGLSPDGQYDIRHIAPYPFAGYTVFVKQFNAKVSYE